MEYLVITIVCFVIFLIGIIFLIQGPPYVPSNDEFTGQIIANIKNYNPKKILDMGSGEGKLVIALAELGYRVEGIELNPLLVLRSRKLIKQKGLQNKATIKWGNFWKYDTRTYDVVVLYVIKHIMPKLEKKLLKEMDKNSYIFSNYFVFPNLKPIVDEGLMKIYKT